MNPAELTGAQLDYWVAKAEGFMRPRIEGDACVVDLPDGHPFAPSFDWNIGGPIIEREKLLIQPKLENGDWYGTWRSVCLNWDGRTHADVTGPTPLIAAMRCYVASTIGRDA